jgi:hypothetical protein
MFEYGCLSGSQSSNEEFCELSRFWAKVKSVYPARGGETLFVRGGAHPGTVPCDSPETQMFQLRG